MKEHLGGNKKEQMHTGESKHFVIFRVKKIKSQSYSSLKKENGSYWKEIDLIFQEEGKDIIHI